MLHSIVISFAFMVILLSACSGNKNHTVSNVVDSIRSKTPLAAIIDTPSKPAGSLIAEQAIDSAALRNVGAMYNMPGDSNSLAHMKDSILSAMSQLSSSSSSNSGATGNSASNRPVPYHEALGSDYVIPVSGTGTGFYYEYVGGSEMNDKKSGLSFTMMVDPAKNSGWNVYYDGYAQMPQFGINTHYSFLMNNSFTHLVLNNDHKVYTSQKAEQAIQERNYSVTNIKVSKIGNEKLHGFNCVHAKVTAVTHFMNQIQDNEFDVWRSEEVPGSSFLESSIEVLASPFTLSMENELVKMGCKGAIVKIEFNEKSSLVRKELYKITKQNVDDSIFNIPPGYKEDKNTSLYSLMK